MLLRTKILFLNIDQSIICFICGGGAIQRHRYWSNETLAVTYAKAYISSLYCLHIAPGIELQVSKFTENQILYTYCNYYMLK